MKSVVLCGVGGYGQVYVKELLQSSRERGVKWVGVVDPFPEKVPRKAEIDAAGVPWFTSIDEFYKSRGADLCVVATPIGFHAEQSVLALRNGSHVLCEKPVAALPSESAAMAAARDRARKTLSIGYQWSYTDSIRRLKHDVLSGVYGRPLSIRTRVLWPRDGAYFKRSSGWAGLVRDMAGRWYLDSVANNATSHYLHNMLYILGEPGRSAAPDNLSAVLMRAYPIQMYDTAFINMHLGGAAGGALVQFIATHAGEEQDDVTCRFEFEDGVVTYDGNAGEQARFIGTLKGGATRDYGGPNAEEPRCAIWKVVAAIRGEDDTGFSCPIEAAIPHNRAMVAALLSTRIGDFPDVREADGYLRVYGLNDLCRRCYDESRLPTCGDAAWAEPGAIIKLDDPRIDAYGSDDQNT